MACADRQILFDAGGFAPEAGGHSHSDALSLIVRQGDQELLIDPGTYAYVGDAHLRNWFRGSAAHNTIRIGGRDQATPAGPFPTWMVETVPVAASIRETVPSVPFVTQTARALGSTATPVGSSPTWIGTAVPDSGSTRDTVPSVALATQTAPRPNAIPLGPAPTEIDRLIEPDRRSISPTALASIAGRPRVPLPRVSGFQI